MEESEENKELVKKKILKTYFIYHIPLIILSLLLFGTSYITGVHSTIGLTTLILGIIFLALTPPISLYLTKRKLSHIYKK